MSNDNAMTLTKDTPFGDMIAHIKSMVKPGTGVLVYMLPLAFLERIIDTRSLTVIHHALEDILNITKENQSGAFTLTDFAQVSSMYESTSLDHIWLVAHQMCADARRNPNSLSCCLYAEKAKEIRAFMEKYPEKRLSDLRVPEDPLMELISRDDGLAKLAERGVKTINYTAPDESHRSGYRSPYRIRVVRVSEEAKKNANYEACTAILRACLLSYTVENDRPFVMKSGRGKLNPRDGFVIEIDGKTVLTDWEQVADWIKEKAIKPL